MSDIFQIDEDFVGAGVAGSFLHTRSGAWLIGGVGTPAISVRVSEDNAPGIVRIATSAVTNDVASLILGMNKMCAASAIAEISFRFRAFGTLDTQIMLGVFDDATLPGTVARYMLYDTSGPDFITSVSSESGSDLITTTAAPDGTTFNTVTFRRTGDGALASVIVTDEDGVVIARGVHDAEFVDSTQVFLILQVKTLTAASRGVDIDRVTLRTRELTR
jgi:hypothetical protein